MKNVLLILFTFCCSTFGAYGQAIDKPSIFPERAISIGYYGYNFGGPGFQVGYEKSLAEMRNFQILFSSHLTYFSSPDNFKALTLVPRIGMRYHTKWGLFLDYHFGLGYAYRIFDYSKFRIDNQGNIVDESIRGSSSVLPNIAVGLGYRLPFDISMPIYLYARPSVGLLLPSGHVLFEMFPALETGVIIELKKKG